MTETTEIVLENPFKIVLTLEEARSLVYGKKVIKWIKELRVRVEVSAEELKDDTGT